METVGYNPIVAENFQDLEQYDLSYNLMKTSDPVEDY